MPSVVVKNKITREVKKVELRVKTQLLGEDNTEWESATWDELDEYKGIKVPIPITYKPTAKYYEQDTNEEGL